MSVAKLGEAVNSPPSYRSEQERPILKISTHMTRLRLYLGYYKTIIALGLPILVGQLGMIATAFADNIMVGQHSTIELAAAAFVNNFFNVSIMMCIGFTYGLTPLIGSLFAQGEKEEIGRTLRSGLRVNILYSAVIIAIMAILYFFVDRLGQPRELLPYIRPYYLLALAGMVPIVLFNVWAQWSYAIHNTVMPTVIVLTANVVNILGNYLLIGGNWGFPELGLTGAGISTLISRLLCPVLIIACFFTWRRFAPYRHGFYRAAERLHSPRTVFSTSLPVSFQIGMECGSFALAALFAGMLPNGTLSLAAFQVLVIVGTLGFCVYYSMGTSVAVMVANALGRKNREEMRRVGWAGYHVILAIAVVSSTIFLTCGEWLIDLFSKNDRALTALAVAQLFPLVLYQLGDATQINFAAALRGTGRVMPMTWIAFVSYIVIGIPATWYLSVNMGLQGIFFSFSISLFTAGALFLTYFLRATNSRSTLFEP